MLFMNCMIIVIIHNITYIYKLGKIIDGILTAYSPYTPS